MLPARSACSGPRPTWPWAKMKWLSHGVTRPESCSQFLSLTCDTELSGEEVVALSKQNSRFLSKKHLQQTQEHEGLPWHRQEKGELAAPASPCSLWLQRAPRAVRPPPEEAPVILGTDWEVWSLRSLCELGVQILLKFKGCLKLHLLKAAENPGVKH